MITSDAGIELIASEERLRRISLVAGVAFALGALALAAHELARQQGLPFPTDMLTVVGLSS